MDSKLRRELSLPDAVGIGLGAIVGAGIFVVTGVAAGVAGASFLLGLIIAGAVAMCNALSSAQLAATYPRSGGTYEYGYEVLNPWLGFVAGWMFLVSKLAAAGTVALGFASYLEHLIPQAPRLPVALVAVVALTALNLFGIRRAGNLNTVIVSVTILGLAYFAVASLGRFDPHFLQPFAPNGASGVMQSAALLFFAYTGYARLATLGDEVRDPKRTIPRAIVISLTSAIVLYSLVATGALGVIGAERMAATQAPIEGAAVTLGAPGLAALVGIAAATAMLGVLLSQILGISRMMFAMAGRRDLPEALARVSEKHAVPFVGVLATGLIVLVVTLVGRIDFIIAAASFTILLYYTIANLAALKMRREDKLFPDWIPALGLLSCLALAASLKPLTIMSGLALLVAGLIWRLAFRRLARQEGDGR